MKKLAVAIAAILISAPMASSADNDPIKIREALMEANGASAAVAGAMLKGDLDYNPAVAKAAIEQLHATAVSFGSFFPEGSQGDSTASPKIWEDKEGFQKALDKFEGDTEAAVKASGKEGPADLNAFKEAMMPVLGNCKSCHQDFRVKKN